LLNERLHFVLLQATGSAAFLGIIQTLVPYKEIPIDTSACPSEWKYFK